MIGRCIFIDRDGVVNVERNYVHRIEDFEFVSGTPEAIRRLNNAGWTVVVVTNQSGIGRGFYTEADYQLLTVHIRKELARLGAHLDAVYHCPHTPDWNPPYGCDCRKPRPGLIFQAQAAFGLDLRSAVLVGDKKSDIDAGRAAGVPTCFLVESGHALRPGDRESADGVFTCLADCVDLLLNPLPTPSLSSQND